MSDIEIFSEFSHKILANFIKYFAESNKEVPLNYYLEHLR